MSDTTPEHENNEGEVSEAHDSESGGAGTVPTNDEAIDLANEPESAPAANTAVFDDSVFAETAAGEPVAADTDVAAAADWSEPVAAKPVAAEPTVQDDVHDTVIVESAPAARAEPAPAVPVEAAEVPVAYPVAPVAPQQPAPEIDYAAAGVGAAGVAGAAAAASATPGALYDPATTSPTGQYVASPQPIFVQAPTPPANKGNRGIGILIGLLATLAFALLYAAGTYLISLSQNASVETASESFALFISKPVFYIPVIFFFGAFALLVAIVNRGGWWAYVLGGFAVAVIVYFSFIGGSLLTVNAWEMTPSQAAQFIAGQWLNPVAIIAAIAAREVPIWFGAWIAARGRKVTARNIEARREYDRVLAEGPTLTRP
ncbi:hypothetical protein EV379_0412 [Microterricola gilva]|uniref:Uncharacterized protein n=1 Tax=Microterricola gilva TaxID=393267 RepID=A0A4Q8AIB2_9MICO|nr:hypothetical protein [Microterricola gilva]RZU64118.1 hypothetical protein EV379_0412 [Microterricola gilva]